MPILQIPSITLPELPTDPAETPWRAFAGHENFASPHEISRRRSVGTFREKFCVFVASASEMPIKWRSTKICVKIFLKSSVKVNKIIT